MAPETAARLRELPKGDALTTAQLAGIMAAKRTSELIPLCHPLAAHARRASTLVVDDGVEIIGVGRDERADRRRDGGADRGLGRRAHRLRHGEGDRQADVVRGRAAGEDEVGERGGADGLGSRVARRGARTRAATCSRSCCAATGTRSPGASSPTRRTQIASRSRSSPRGAALVLTTGGTGLAPRDVTPEATRTRAAARGAGDRRGAPRRLDREDAARAALTRSRGRRSAAPSSSTCPARPAAAATVTPFCGPRSATRCRFSRDEPTAARADFSRCASPASTTGSSSSSTRSLRCRSRTSARSSPSTGVPSAHDLLWITVAMVGARSLAMALNRLIDARIDAANPRTAGRELPSGALTPCGGGRLLPRLARRSTWSPSGSSTRSSGGSSPMPVIAFVVYPYLKRFTWLCHLWLGAVDGLAPVGAWAAITGQLPWQAWALGGAVAAWVAGLRPLLRALRRRRRPRAGAALLGHALRRGRRVPRRAHPAPDHDRAARRRRARRLHVGVLYWLGVLSSAGAAPLRAHARASGRPAASRRGVLHDERRHLRRVLRLRARRRAVIVGLLHPGEMGSAVGARCRTRGHEVLWASEGRSDATRERARAASATSGTARRARRRGRGDPLDLPAARVRVDVAARLRGLRTASTSTRTRSRRMRAAGGRARLHPRFVDGGIVGGPPARARQRRSTSRATRRRRVAALFAGSSLDDACRARRLRGEDGVRRVVEGHGGDAARDPRRRASTSASRTSGASPRRSSPTAACGASARPTKKGWRWVGEMEEIADTFDGGRRSRTGFHRAAAEVYRA